MQGLLASRPFLAGVLLVTLAFGLYPKNSPLLNAAYVENGWLNLPLHSIAQTEQFLAPGIFSSSPDTSFSLEFAVSPQITPDHFSLIALFPADDPAEQLLVGQWQQYLIVMSGDDYDHTRRQPRLSAQMPRIAEQHLAVKVLSTESGSKMWFAGKLVAKIPEALALPEESTHVRFGNSNAGDKPWSGQLARFVLVVGNKSFTTLPASASANVQLEIPRLPFYDRGIQDQGGLGRNDRTWDITLNFLGFIPLGFVLTAFFTVSSVSSTASTVARSTISSLLLTIFSVILVSTTIEVCQFWLASRHPSYIDVLMNLLGGLAGLLAYRTTTGLSGVTNKSSN